ncbi:F-box only protein 15 [Gouania willdenowi]|uniref:F-box only protein 15 n=1 Tax=Gouania willdenowi TaxID=441366 RepID=UPI0010565D2C|nr:F-box only protein 15 [Gouania willdenowi]
MSAVRGVGGGRKEVRKTYRKAEKSSLTSAQSFMERNPNVTWELRAINKSGLEHTWKPSRVKYFNTCVTMSWNVGSFLTNLMEVVTFHLRGVERKALRCPGLKRSLMETVHVQTERVEVLGQDGLLELKLLESGFLIGVWKRDQSVAFIMSSLHLNNIESTEESSAGNNLWPKNKPPFDDVDPEYGLHGYRLHVVLHNTNNELMSESFSKLFCRRGEICDGKILLTVISRSNLSQHIRLTQEVVLPWWCEALQGTVKNCCFMTLTLLDEHDIPFKSVSYPVSLKLEEASCVYYDYDGENYLIHYQDPDLQVQMVLVSTEGQKTFVVVSLVVYLSVSSVNQHFNRDY